MEGYLLRNDRSVRGGDRCLFAAGFGRRATMEQGRQAGQLDRSGRSGSHTAEHEGIETELQWPRSVIAVGCETQHKTTNSRDSRDKGWRNTLLAFIIISLIEFKIKQLLCQFWKNWHVFSGALYNFRIYKILKFRI